MRAIGLDPGPGAIFLRTPSCVSRSLSATTLSRAPRTAQRPACWSFTGERIVSRLYRTEQSLICSLQSHMLLQGRTHVDHVNTIHLGHGSELSAMPCLRLRTALSAVLAHRLCSGVRLRSRTPRNFAAIPSAQHVCASSKQANPMAMKAKEITPKLTFLLSFEPQVAASFSWRGRSVDS